MLLTIVKTRRWRIVGITALHAFLCVLFWTWMGGIALGLGFKDRDKWTAWDRIQFAAVPPIALTITAPGRFFYRPEVGWMGLTVPWLANSLLWSLVLVAAYERIRSRS